MDPQLKQYLEKLSEDVKGVFEEIKGIRAIVSETNSKLDKVTEKTEFLDREVSEIKEENQQLKARLNHLEQYSRKFDVIINGITKTENENLNETIKNLAEVLEVKLNPYDICGLHRLPTSKGKIPSIILCLNNLEVKGNFIRASKQKKISSDAIGVSPVNKIFVDEHLTSANGRLLSAARRATKANLLATARYRNGKILVRYHEDEEEVEITGEEQIPGEQKQEEQDSQTDQNQRPGAGPVRPQSKKNQKGNAKKQVALENFNYYGSKRTRRNGGANTAARK